MQEIFKRLSTEFCARQLKNNIIKLTLPLVTWTDGCLLELRIKLKEDGDYTIYSPTNLFVEKNAGGSQKYYFNIFEKHDKNYHYDIKIKNGKIYKDYASDYNIAVAINEFIRFYVMLDDFIIKNSVIGHEEDFE